jgi:hypothetical protein
MRGALGDVVRSAAVVVVASSAAVVAAAAERSGDWYDTRPPEMGTVDLKVFPA